MSKQLQDYQKTKLLLLRKFMEVQDLSDKLNEEKFQLTREIERLNQLISEEEEAIENNRS